jgi:hypothetical protein
MTAAVDALSVSMFITAAALSGFHAPLADASALLPSSSWPGDGIKAMEVAMPPCCSIWGSVHI